MDSDVDFLGMHAGHVLIMNSPSSSNCKSHQVKIPSIFPLLIRGISNFFEFDSLGFRKSKEKT